MNAPIYEFTSHTSGKNAKVSIFPDRIEWKKEGSKIGRATAASLTIGLSLLGGKKEESEMIPMRAVSHVATKRDGLMNSKVVVTTGGGNIEFRVSHSEASKVKAEIMKAMLGA